MPRLGGSSLFYQACSRTLSRGSEIPAFILSAQIAAPILFCHTAQDVCASSATLQCFLELMSVRCPCAPSAERCLRNYSKICSLHVKNKSVLPNVPGFRVDTWQSECRGLSGEAILRSERQH